jgi:hypothetical protein
MPNAEFGRRNAMPNADFGMRNAELASPTCTIRAGARRDSGAGSVAPGFSRGYRGPKDPTRREAAQDAMTNADLGMRNAELGLRG